MCKEIFRRAGGPDHRTLLSERVEGPAPSDQPAVLVEPRSRSVRMLSLALVLVAGALLTVVTHGLDAGWIGLAFFVPCTGIFTFNLVKPPRLILTGQGFRFFNLWRRSPLFEWGLAHGFRPRTVTYWTTIIAFTYDGDAPRWRGLLAAANRAMTKRNAALPSTYGMRPQDLADLLERWRRTYAGDAAPEPGPNSLATARARSTGQSSATAGTDAEHTAEVWLVVDNQDPPTFKPYYAAHCTCGWVGFARSGRRAQERAQEDATSHTPDVTPDVRRPVG